MDPWLIKKDKISAFSVAKKSAFLAIFLLTIFENRLKYTYISQQANINRQQAAFNRHFISHSLARSQGQQAQIRNSLIAN